MTDYIAIIESGNSVLHRALVVLAAIVGGYFFKVDSNAWPIPARQRLLIIAVVSYGAVFGAAVPSFFATGIVGNQVANFFYEAHAQFEGALMASIYGPKTILGGLIFGFLCVAVYKRVAGISFDTSDSFARGVVATMFVGRLGCIAQHCCFGRSTGLWFGIEQGDHIKRYPVQIFEAVFLAFLFFMLSYLRRNKIFMHKQLFIIYVVYGFVRFLLEFLREPVAQPILGLGFYQWMAIVLIAVGGYQLRLRSLATYKFA